MTQPVLNETMGEGITLETLMQYDRMEVIDGALQEKAMTGFTHVHIIGNIVDLIRPFVKKHRLGFFWGDGLTCILHEDKNRKIRVSRLPDSCFIRSADMPQFDHDRPFPGAPTLAIEVASPKESNAELLAKVTDY
ncbi:MAG: Uma2 family endonuclease, partial [Aggregatilineales bacterium]